MSTSAALRLGSRGSALALWQAGYVAGELRRHGVACEIVTITTSGDRNPGPRLAEAGGKGLFVKELEAALLAGEIDFAVHSLKDVPSRLPEAFTLAAVPHRADPRDALVGAAGMTLATLRPGMRVGTGSLRRQAQLLALRADLEVAPLRGNVDTRLARFRAGGHDALILAAAGLQRLGRGDAIAECISPWQMCPAPGQGALGLECRAGDESVRDRLWALHDTASGAAVTAERALAARLDCGCQAPVGAWAHRHPDGLYVTAMVAAPDGSEMVRVGIGAEAGEPPESLGARAAEILLERGAAAILAALPAAAASS